MYQYQFLGQIIEMPITTSCAAACDYLQALAYDVTAREAHVDLSIFEILADDRRTGITWQLQGVGLKGKVRVTYPPMIQTGQSPIAVAYVDALAEFGRLSE